MEYRILSLVIEELAGILPGARLDKVVPVGIDDFVLLLHQKRKTHCLLLAPGRILPRIHLLSRKPAATTSPPPFFLSLKKQLTGCRLIGIRLINEDRVVEVRFSRLDGEFYLVLELLGSSPNLLLTDDGHRIIAVHRPVPPGDRIARPLVPGITYEPPAVRQSFARKVDGGMDLPVHFEGAEPLKVNRAVEEIFEGLSADRERTGLRQGLATALKKALARTERRFSAVQRDLAAAERGDDHRRMGELILANLALLKRGQERADLPDQEGTLYAVALDPSRSPTENAERYFRRYKKAKAGLAVLQERLEETRGEREHLRAVQRDLEAAGDLPSLTAVRALLEKSGLVRGKEDKVARLDRSAPPYRAVTYEGWDILIGRSAAGNDYVTMQLARPDDLWLHAEGMPGSHVLVRNPQKREIPSAVVKKAASLAAYYSKGKGSAKVPVAYTTAKYVKKPKGAAPGTVLLRERKTVMAVPEPDQRT